MFLDLTTLLQLTSRNIFLVRKVFLKDLPAKNVAIELVGVNKWFGDFHVLKDISLTVGAGEKVVICGPSGSGKSTVVRCINRLEAHQKGTIHVDGIEVTNDPKSTIIHPWN